MSSARWNPRTTQKGYPWRQFWQMAKASLDGPRINAVSALPGIDWFAPYPNGYGRPHVRLPFRTKDGAIVLLEYRGIVEASEAFLNAVEKKHIDTLGRSIHTHDVDI